MKSVVVVSLVAVSMAAVVGSAARSAPPEYPKQITYVPAEKRLNAVSTGVVAPGGTNELIPRHQELGIRVSMGKKPATPPITEVEVHTTFGHVYLIEEGDGTLVLGGEMVEPRESRGEWRSASVRGGQEFEMKKGDMITVQVGMPHWWKRVGPNGIAYLAFHSFPEHNQPK